MTPKPVAVFHSDLPNDFVIEGRDLIEVGGRNVTEEIRAIMTKLGCEASTLVDGGVKGWGFNMGFEGEGFWCHVRSYYPAYYLVFTRHPHREIALGKDPLFGRLWTALNSAIEADPRFHDVQWHHSLHEAPPPPKSWFGWALGARKPPGFLARNVARPLGWLSLALSPLPFLDSINREPLAGVGYLVVSAVLLSIGYKRSHVFGVRLPWVLLP
jgi:hypothetical protein